MMHSQARATLLIVGCWLLAGCAQSWNQRDPVRPMVLSPPPAPAARPAESTQPASAVASQQQPSDPQVRAQSKDDPEGPLPIEPPKNKSLKGFIRKATSIARPGDSEEAARALFQEGDALFVEKKYEEAKAIYYSSGNQYH